MVNTKVKKPVKKTTTKKAAQKKSSKTKKNSNNGVYKVENTLKVRRANINELRKVENVIEKLSRGNEQTVRKTVPVAEATALIVQKTAQVVQETDTTVKKTVPGVLRIEHDVQYTSPTAPKVIPIVEARDFLKKCVKQYWASA